jgi:deoxyribonuclease V
MQSRMPAVLTPVQAVDLQRELVGRLRLEKFPGRPSLVAGVDVSCQRGVPFLWGGVVVMDLRSMAVVESQVVRLRETFPYVPGLLSFRELPVLLAAISRLRCEPDVALVDGQGIAHPRRMGIAAHLGLLWDVPTIGCGKSRLVGDARGELGRARGSRRLLYDRGEKVGSLLRTRDGVKPLWVSPGHRMDIASAVRIVLACTGRYRLPEPIRAAHHCVGDARRRDVAS